MTPEEREADAILFAAQLQERLEVYKQIEGEVVEITPENEADR